MQGLDFYWLRQPLLSIERLLAVLAEDDMTSLFADEDVMEAIRIASSPVADELLKGSPFSTKLSETALKYILRMGTRCTPFGLFAGGAVGYVASRTQFDFKRRQLVPQHRLDMQVLMKLAHELAEKPLMRRQLRFITNETVHRTGNRVRYIERQWSNDHWQYFTSEVPADPAILTVLDLARSGALLSDLVRAVAGEATEDEARHFMDRLIEDGLLYSELLPSPTGPDPLTSLIEKVASCSDPLPALTDLVAIQRVLAHAVGQPQPARLVKAILEEGFGLAVENGSLLQTDTRIDKATNQISGPVLRELQNRLAPLCVLNQFNHTADDLTAFKRRFYARYEEEEVPLLVALDEDIGIGYGHNFRALTSAQDLISELLDHDSTNPVSTIKEDGLHQLRLKLYAAWSLQPDQPIMIMDQDLAQLGPMTTTLPDSFYAFGYFLSASATDLDAGKYRFYLKALSGPSAFSLMGRFCASDPALHKLVLAELTCQQAEQPDRVLAEIVHLTQARAGNVVQRPHLRSYEIPLLSTSTLPIDQQLSLDDLVVSVPQGSHIVLRSKRLGKEVIPQLTTAHNYQQGLSIYRFLGDLQQQPTAFSANWSWGALASCQRLPRVQYKNIILQEATWLFKLADLIATATTDHNVLRLREKYQLPRLIALQQGDQELFLDLDSSICRQLFVSTLRRVKTLQIIEWLRAPSDCPVDGPDGKLTHEVIIPFVSQTRALAYAASLKPSIATAGLIQQRSFLPGSEWLYLKVYCGITTAAIVLAHVTSLARRLLDSGQVSHWFFIRYADPDPHLRFRFKLTAPSQYAFVLKTCQEALSDYIISGEVHRVLTDTYRRELERYGERSIELTERIFWRDSELVSDLLKLDLSDTLLFQTAMLVIDGYQASFELTQQEKQLHCEHMYKALLAKQEAPPNLRQALAIQYRKNQSAVLRLVQQEFQESESELVCSVNRFRSSISSYVTTVRHNFSSDEQRSKQDYIGNVGHMFINRLFTSHQPHYELLVYHHLYRAHQSISAQLSKENQIGS